MRLSHRAARFTRRPGKSSSDIAVLINVSERTVNFHINNVIRKLILIERSRRIAARPARIACRQVAIGRTMERRSDSSRAR
jgi:hypothetical protein